MEQISFPLSESQIQEYLYRKDACLALWGRDGKVIDVNIPTLGLFGFSSKEEYHVNFVSPLCQPDGKSSKETMRQMLESAFEHGHADFDWLHKNKSGFHFDCHIQMVLGEYKKESVVCAFIWGRYGDDLPCMRQCKRIEGIKGIKIEEAQREQEVMERWTIINEALPIGINFWDEKLNFIDGNEMGYKLFDFPSKEYWKENWQDSMPEFQPDGSHSLEKMANGFKKTVKEGSHRFEWLHYTIAGEPLPLDITMVRVKYKDSYMVACMLQDLRSLQESDAKMREAHELTQMILDSAPFVINLWDKSGTLLQTSHQALQLYNVASKEEYVQNFYKLSPKRQPCGTLSSEMIPYYLNQAYQEGRAQFEWMHCTLDGIEFPTEIILVRFEKKGEFMLVAYTIDLSADKAAAQRERDANEINEIFHNASPFVMNMWDENCKLVSTSHQSVAMFNVKSKEEYIERFFELSPQYQPCGTPSDEKAIKYIKETFSTKEKIVFEWMHQTLSGEPLPMEITLFHFTRQGKNMVASFAADLRPVKAAMDMERERELHERVRLFFDASPMGVIIYGEDHRLIDCNASSVAMFGFSNKEDFVAELDRIFPVLSPEYQPCGTRSIEKAMEIFDKVSSEAYAKFEWMHQDANGNELPTETSIVIVPYKDTFEIVSYIQDMRQINVAKETERIAEVAEESSKAKSRFLARMSHEIRTPITAVLGIAEIELQNTNLSPQLEESFAKIYSSSNILLGIINDILDLSKIEANKMTIIEEEYDLASMISDIAHLHLSYVGDKDILFHLDVDKNLPASLIGDKLRIKQIANNLLSNAFKYTESGTVKLSFGLQKDNGKDGHIRLIITISDTGLGMTKEQLATLYSEYTRFHELERRYISGTGLGMSIVYSLAKMMDADIKIESEKEKGTSVVVDISQKAYGYEVLGSETVDSLQHFEMDTQAIVKRFKFMPEPMPYGNVLVVDDVETNLYVVQGLLAFYKLNIETCLSGYEAINKIKQGKVYDIIFMDHMMPGLNGTEAMYKIRDMGYTQPIIAFTANAMIGKAEEFIENGFDGFISKPITTNQLNTILIKHIRDKQPAETIEAAKKLAEQSGIHDYMEGAELKEKLRLDFARSQKNTFPQICEALKTGDIETAHRMAHTLKSLAGLMGENSLEQAAQTVESILMNNKIPTNTDLNNLESELKHVLEDIGTPAATAIFNKQLLDKNKAIALFDRLEHSLKSENANCLMFLDELKTIPETAVLCRQIDNFDFSAALVTLGMIKIIFEEQ